MLGVRRLAAIAATNVVGYSGLIGLGQERHAQRFKAHRRETHQTRAESVKYDGEGRSQCR